MIRSARYFGNLPSIKTLTSQLNISKEKAEQIRMVINMRFYDFVDHYESNKLDNPVPRTTKWIDGCYNEPNQVELILEAINEITDGHGVEYIKKNGKIAIEYVNMGDTYTPTIVFNRETWTFRCCCWGDIVERGRYD